MNKQIVIRQTLFWTLILVIFSACQQAVRADDPGGGATPVPEHLKSARAQKANPQKTPKRTRGVKAKVRKIKLPPFFLGEIKGDVYLVRKGVKKRAHRFQKLVTNDRVVTGNGGKGYLEFRDGGTIEIGQASNVKIREMNITDKAFKARFFMAFGKMKVIWHRVKTSSSLFEIESGGVVAGVRGTIFEVDYDKDKKQEATKTYDGTVYTRVDGEERLVEKGFSNVVEEGSEPVVVALTEEDAKEFKEFIKTDTDLENEKEALIQQEDSSADGSNDGVGPEEDQGGQEKDSVDGSDEGVKKGADDSGKSSDESVSGEESKEKNRKDTGEDAKKEEDDSADIPED